MSVRKKRRKKAGSARRVEDAIQRQQVLGYAKHRDGGVFLDMLNAAAVVNNMAKMLFTANGLQIKTSGDNIYAIVAFTESPFSDIKAFEEYIYGDVFYIDLDKVRAAVGEGPVEVATYEDHAVITSGGRQAVVKKIASHPTEKTKEPSDHEKLAVKFEVVKEIEPLRSLVKEQVEKGVEKYTIAKFFDRNRQMEIEYKYDAKALLRLLDAIGVMFKRCGFLYYDNFMRILCRREPYVVDYYIFNVDKTGERKDLEDELRKLPVDYVYADDEVVVRINRGLPEDKFRETVETLKKMGFRFNPDTKTWRKRIVNP
ncbi:MAG: hypothetical protein ACK4SY_07580 [Pyrobaculum sp.]